MRGALFLLFLFTISGIAQKARLTVPIDEGRRVVLKSTVHPWTRSAVDLGRVEPSRKIGPLIILLKRTPTQQAGIKQLLEDQRDVNSPQFHQWLTPEQYADRFGLAEDDVSTLRSWIRSHGLIIDHSARGRNWIGFSGTARQIESALGTEIHRYRIGSEEHFANSTEISVPAALEPVAGAFIGLHDFQPRPRYTINPASHALAPDDLATIYDITSLYNTGIDGTGQTIAIMGQSNLEPNFADIRAFRKRFSLPAADPQVILYGQDPGVDSGWQREADLDLEWSGAIARKASLIFVNSNNVLTSSIYAIDQNLAPVISASYVVCEQSDFFLAYLFQAIIQQGNTQGITYVAASGDAGPSNCDNFDYSPLATNGLVASFPASIPEITGVGGTEFNEGTGTYWIASNTAAGASAISYIPEMAWNDAVVMDTVVASGGGPSILFAKPVWQAGKGVPADSVRDTPDVAMPASAVHDGYWECNRGGCDPFGGGTSAATPVFAGIVALLNQAAVSKGVQSQAGLGNINPDLYRIANTTTNAFHDITVGDNIVPCAMGTPDCTTGTLGYSAGPGYDMATGLGSVDVANLVSSWNLPRTPTTLTVEADSTSILMSDSVHLTITVTSSPSSALPRGTVYVKLSNVATPESHLPAELPLYTASLVAGSATVQIYGGQLNPGTNTITVTYSGDVQFTGSSEAVTVNVTIPTGNSAVVPAAYPYYYDYQTPPVGELPANHWRFVLRLREAAGVRTTVTGLSINGADETSKIGALFGATILEPHGTLQGGWDVSLVSVPSTIPVIISGQDDGGSTWTTGLQIAFVGGPERFVNVGAVVNAASFEPVGAPGMIMSIFGGILSTQASGQAQSLPLPMTLAGSKATINGVPAPYYFASYGQVNIQVPYETAPGDAVLTITGWIGEGANFAFKVRPSAPGIFVDTSDGAPVPSKTGSPGEEVVLYITGDGLVTPGLATGASPAPGTPLDQLPQPKLPVTVFVANRRAPIAFIGITPGIAGATQINYIIPPDAPLGLVPVIVQVGDVASPPAWMTLR